MARFLKKKVYEVSSRRVPKLNGPGYAPRSLADRRLRHNELTEIGIRHSLFIADIHAHAPPHAHRFHRARPLAGRPGTLGFGHPKQRRFPYPRSARTRISSWKHAERAEGRNRFHVFLEADRSTMSHERMAAKIAGYVAYYEQERHRQKYPA